LVNKIIKNVRIDAFARNAGRTHRLAGEPRKGELRLRETTPQETADAQARARFFELMKANLGKSEAEIHAMMRAA
jgi:hypothetical protein